MTDTLRLRLVTPERLVLDEEVEEITAPGTLGEFGVLPNHTTFLSSLEIGGLTYKKGGEIHSLAVSDGFAEVENDSVTVLCRVHARNRPTRGERSRWCGRRKDEKYCAYGSRV